MKLNLLIKVELNYITISNSLEKFIIRNGKVKIYT